MSVHVSLYVRRIYIFCRIPAVYYDQRRGLPDSILLYQSRVALGIYDFVLFTFQHLFGNSAVGASISGEQIHGMVLGGFCVLLYSSVRDLTFFPGL